MEKKNFLGLDGLKHFWKNAKAWIIDRITTEVTEAISGKADKSHTHTKSQITDFPTSLPANGGTADNAKRLKPFVYYDYPYVYDETNGIRLHVLKYK